MTTSEDHDSNWKRPEFIASGLAVLANVSVSMVANPTFSGLLVGLAVGLAAACAIFGVYNAYLVPVRKPLPSRRAANLHELIVVLYRRRLRLRLLRTTSTSHKLSRSRSVQGFRTGTT
jgi:hypothetical protein